MLFGVLFAAGVAFAVAFGADVAEDDFEAGVDFGDVPVELEVTYRDVSRTPCLVPRVLGSQERADGDGDGDGVTGWSLRPAGAPARPTRVRVIRAGCRSPRLAPDRASPGRPALEDLINDLEQGVRSR